MKITQKLKSMSGVWLVVLAIGIALGGYFIGDGIYRAMSGRTVTVKGLAERDVVADTAVWNIKINGVGGDLAELQQRIDDDITEINT
ncbi:MAG: SIMPL domain-containing protein, partial [Alphaproteobacteria bacterium]|nr:SIMPL domain-containing protein [Alphaproteobacteria bacterium]